MAVRLRTRLFLVVAALLGASIAVSALLSRRATLVEVRAIVARWRTAGGSRDRCSNAPAAAVHADRGEPARDVLTAIAARDDLARSLVVHRATRTVVAASNPALAAAACQAADARRPASSRDLATAGPRCRSRSAAPPARRVARSEWRRTDRRRCFPPLTRG